MAKRGNNEGSVYQRKDGRWVGVMSTGYENGRLQRKYFYATTREEASRKLRSALAQQDKGLPPADDSITVGAHLDQWLGDAVRPSVRPQTFRSYEGHVRIHIKPALGKVTLAKLTPGDLQRCLNQKLEALSVGTVNRIRATLRKALSDAVKWGILHRNVAKLVSLPKEDRPRPDPYSPEEARALPPSGASAWKRYL